MLIERTIKFGITVSTILISGILLVMVDANAAMYKWVDEDGNTHYTQQRPADGVDYETKKPPPPVDTEKAINTFRQKEEEAKEQREANQKSGEEAAKSGQDQAELKKKCENLRLRQQSLQRPRVSTTDESGNRVRMSEEDRLNQIKEIKKLMSEHCK